ncbi:MAG: Hpt domain-containing protein [Acidimicrobiales bacterium]
MLDELVEDIGPEDVTELLDLYLADAPVQLDSARAGVAAGDPEQVARAAHTLKSTSAMLGAAALSAVCQDLEERARHQPPGDLAPPVAELGRLVDQASRALAEVRARLGGG